MQNFIILKTEHRILIFATTFILGCVGTTEDKVPNAPEARPLKIIEGEPNAEPACKCTLSEGIYIQNDSSMEMSTEWVASIKVRETKKELTPVGGGPITIPGNDKKFLGCSIYDYQFGCLLESKFELVRPLTLASKPATVAVYGAVGPSIATCKAWCSAPDDPASGNCLELGVRMYKAIAPISLLVEESSASGESIPKEKILAKYNLSESDDKCQRGNVTRNGNKFINEGKTEACVLESAELPESVSKNFKIRTDPAKPLKAIGVLPIIVEAEKLPDAKGLSASNMINFPMQEKAPWITFDGAGGKEFTQLFGGSILGAARIQVTGMPKQTILATTNGCIAVDEP